MRRAAAILVEPVEPHNAAQIALGDSSRHVEHLAFEQELARLHRKNGRHRIVVPALRLAYCRTDIDRLGRGAVDAPLLHFGASPRRLAGCSNGAVLDADLASHSLRPLPGRHFVHDALESTHVDRGQRIGREPTHRHRGHLSFGISPAHRVAVHHGALEVRRRHEGPHAVGAADLHAH